MIKSEKNKLKDLDRMLDNWEKNDKAHTANVKRLAEIQKHDLDWFDLEAYQNMIYGSKRK